MNNYMTAVTWVELTSDKRFTVQHCSFTFTFCIVIDSDLKRKKIDRKWMF